MGVDIRRDGLRTVMVMRLGDSPEGTDVLHFADPRVIVSRGKALSALVTKAEESGVSNVMVLGQTAEGKALFADADSTGVHLTNGAIYEKLSLCEARDLADRMVAAGRLSSVGSGGIAGDPTNDQIIRACAWGAAQGRRVVHALVDEGYGARTDRYDMVLVFSPLAFYAFQAASKGLKGMLGESAVNHLPGVLPIEWSLWVPKRHPAVTGKVSPWQAELAFSPVLYQEGRRIEPAKVNREKAPLPLLARWGPEVIVTVTAYYRLGDLRLDCPTDVSFFLGLRNFHGWAQYPDRSLSFRLDFGKLS
jgi:hypothetical protein